jgi:hypothetical protein
LAAVCLLWVLAVVFVHWLPVPLRFGTYDKGSNSHPVLAVGTLSIVVVAVLGLRARFPRGWTWAGFGLLAILAASLPLLLGGTLSGDGLWIFLVPFSLVIAGAAGLCVGAIVEHLWIGTESSSRGGQPAVDSQAGPS